MALSDVSLLGPLVAVVVEDVPQIRRFMRRTPGWYAGLPVHAGSALANPSVSSSNSSTKASTARTELSSPMKSSRHSGISVT
jgi:hypothetical protein